uniref:Protein transport protein SEC23 n=1 Tax=Anthurium amnicola TaxID=1678845 RepID=A0A1D1YAJ9_9ARAE
MGNPPPATPPPAAYTVVVTPSSTPTPPGLEKRMTPPAFSTPSAIRFSPQKSPVDHHSLPTSGTPGSVPSSEGGRTGSPIPQWSTPPGPPVFSSPLRAAAVPFRASPASPQPVPLSSSVSLPSSSPPRFTNGSTGLTSQISAGVDDSTLESPYVLFSAHKVLKHKKLVNISSLGFGALVSPGREITPGPQIVERDPHRCQSCGAYANLYCEVLLGSGQWQCVFCKKLNSSGGEYIAPSREAVRRWPELSSLAIDYVLNGTMHPLFPQAFDSRTTTPIFIIIDECLDEGHLQYLQGSLHAFIDSLPPTTRVGIISYGRTVSVYDFSEGSTASADVLPGGRSPTQEFLKAMINGTGIYLSPVRASLPVAHTIFSSLRPYRQKLPEASRDRCLGTALEVALAIIQGPSAELSHGIIKRPGGNCRILVCAGGPNTYGPGSVPYSFSHPNYSYLEKTAIKWMEHLGHEAQRHNTVVDILCAGTCPIRASVLQPLAKCSGGVLVLHDDFGEAFGVNLQRASSRAAGSHGLFEIRCSDDILVTQIIGPGEEAAADAHESFKNDSSTCIQMLSVEETQSFALSMETKRDIKSDHVFFQFTVHYSTAFQTEISRVITIRLPTVDSVSTYLKSIQVDIASVLIAKRTVLHAKSASDATDMRLTIDERVKDIALKYGHQLPSSKLFRFPKELSPIPENLFHLRRGPLLGSIIGHEDERSVLRNLFLHASFDLSLRKLAPRCLMHREGGTFEELPAYDLAMQSNAAVVLDHGTDVFIWLGAELAAQEGKSAAALAACRTLAEELTEQRFPAPRILAFKEGSSQARYFVSRLIPAHRDPPYEQTASILSSA